MEQAVINTIECFADRRSSVLQNSKSPCFVRLLGWNGHCRDALLNMDAKLSQQMRAGKLYYARCAGLPKLLSAEEAERYKGCCDCWAESGKKIIRTRQDSISRTNAAWGSMPQGGRDLPQPQGFRDGFHDEKFYRKAAVLA